MEVPQPAMNSTTSDNGFLMVDSDLFGADANYDAAGWKILGFKPWIPSIVLTILTSRCLFKRATGAGTMGLLTAAKSVLWRSAVMVSLGRRWTTRI